MIWLLMIFLAIPTIGIAQALAFPETFGFYHTVAGRIALTSALAVYSALLAFVFWARFQRVSPLVMRRASVRLAYVGVVVTLCVPWGMLGLSRIYFSPPEKFVIDFGEAASNSLAGLIISWIALDWFSGRFETLWRSRQIWRYPDDDI